MNPKLKKNMDMPGHSAKPVAIRDFLMKGLGIPTSGAKHAMAGMKFDVGKRNSGDTFFIVSVSTDGFSFKVSSDAALKFVMNAMEEICKSKKIPFHDVTGMERHDYEPEYDGGIDWKLRLPVGTRVVVNSYGGKEYNVDFVKALGESMIKPLADQLLETFKEKNEEIKDDLYKPKKKVRKKAYPNQITSAERQRLLAQKRKQIAAKHAKLK